MPSRFRLLSQAAVSFLRAGVLRIDLADQEDLVAAALDRLADHFLGAAVAIHFGRVDQRQAEIEAEPQRGDVRPAYWHDPPRSKCPCPGQALSRRRGA